MESEDSSRQLQATSKRKLEVVGEDNVAVKFRRGGDNDEETAILRVISQHAEHRGPREAGVGSKPADTLARRYLRGRTWKESSASQLVPAHLQIPMNSHYICHMCGEKGHHIKLCPKRQGRRQSKKIRAATGIPRSWLRPIASEDINLYEDVYCLSNGQLAILKMPNEQPDVLMRGEKQGSVDNELLEDLKCPLCRQVFRDAHLVPCCGMTYCGSCIMSSVSKSEVCPNCKISLKKSEIGPNESVQESLDSLSVAAKGNVLNDSVRCIDVKEPFQPADKVHSTASAPSVKRDP